MEELHDGLTGEDTEGLYNSPVVSTVSEAVDKFFDACDWKAIPIPPRKTATGKPRSHVKRPMVRNKTQVFVQVLQP